MSYSSTTELIDSLQEGGYSQVSHLLNSTNDQLFIGPNNLVAPDKIEDARIYNRILTKKGEIEQLYPEGWSKNSKLTILPAAGVASDDVNFAEPISSHLVGVFTLGRSLTSHLHIVHGGAIASLIDEYFVKVALPLTADNFAVTANLNIKYLRPVRFAENDRVIDVVLDCFVVENVDNRKFKVMGSLCDLNGVKYCVGELLVVVPRNAL